MAGGRKVGSVVPSSPKREDAIGFIERVGVFFRAWRAALRMDAKCGGVAGSVAGFAVDFDASLLQSFFATVWAHRSQANLSASIERLTAQLDTAKQKWRESLNELKAEVGAAQPLELPPAVKPPKPKKKRGSGSGSGAGSASAME